MEEIVTQFGEDNSLTSKIISETSDSITVHLENPCPATIDIHVPFTKPECDVAKAYLVSQVLQEHYMNSSFIGLYDGLVKVMDEEFNRKDLIDRWQIHRYKKLVDDYDALEREGKPFNAEGRNKHKQEYERIMNRHRGLFRRILTKYLRDAFVLDAARRIDEQTTEMLHKFNEENPEFYG